MREKRPNLAVLSALQTRFGIQHLIKDTGRLKKPAKAFQTA
jgi:hypothetical protein